MIVQADKMSDPASRERAQRLYDKNVELENKRHRSVQGRVPSDPNAWQLMRENYEAIILEDHAFAEQHNIEYALWQLHYKRIEELRAHFSALSQGSNTSQGVKGAARSDRLIKLRMQWKTFLSEASGFYHDLILKIRSNYGLPLGYSSETSDSRMFAEKDLKKSANMKKGLISCHRCLIYLGDLARYKGLYGEGDSKAREHAAASSYYLQASALWPSSGNPHHQLAILASYSGDELVAVYRYFRSLALESPFATARDNLIVAFEKNRQNYSQLPGDVKSPDVKDLPLHIGKGSGRVEIKLPLKETNSEAGLAKEKTSSIHEMYKVFCIRFVRLNGLLFTRTSLETLAEVLSLVSSGLCELLSSGPEEEMNFGANAVENGLFFVRLIAILIFTMHNVNKETEGQTYAEILQRAVLVQNSFTAALEIMGHILERSVKLRDPSSSYLLPGILVFVEWLACRPDVAIGSDAEKQSTVGLKFWNQCISFLNKLLSVGPVSNDDNGDDTFFKMSRYEGETENRFALWEDFELRGYLPLLPAQSLLDFSKRLPYGSNDIKERKARVKRILAAGKTLANVVKFDTKTVYFDPKVKKFVLGVQPLTAEDFLLSSYSSIPSKKDAVLENQADKTANLGVEQQTVPLHMEREDDEEEIVFKPSVTEKQEDDIGPKKASHQGLALGHTFAVDLPFYGSSVSVRSDGFQQQAAFDGDARNFVSFQTCAPQIQSQVSKWLVGEEASVANNLRTLRFSENGYVMKPKVQGDMGIFHPTAISAPRNESVSFNANNGMFLGPTKATEPPVPTRISAVPSSGIGSLGANISSVYPAAMKKNPVSRPVRHFGPPPGFRSVPTKQVNGLISGSDFTIENPLVDDYSWLSGHQYPASTKSTAINTYSNFPPYGNSQYVSTTKELNGTASFPFPGKHIPVVQFQMEKQNGQQDYLPPENFKLHNEHQLQQKQFINGNQQLAPLPEQLQGQSGLIGRYIV